MKRKLHIEFLRMFAIFFVIFNHTGLTGFRLYTTTNSSLKFYLYGIISVLCKSAVPIFFMISGAFLLKKEESIKTIFKTRIMRMLIVLLLMSTFYYLYFLNWDISKINFLDLFSKIYSSKITIPLWYLYTYISFLIMLPFLRILAKNITKIHITYICLIIALTYLIDLIAAFASVNINHDIYFFITINYILFPIFGYFIENKLDISLSIKQIIMLLLAITISLFLGIYCNRLEIIRTNNQACQTYLSNFSFTIAIPIYILVKDLFNKIKIPNVLQKVILLFGNCSFGIYLLEEFLRNEFYWKPFNLLKPIFKTMISSFISVFICMCIGALIIYILKKNKYIRKLL